ncbi:MAG: GGDEF domain-containing protein [Lachnospiraceae bacterium]|nr:GGDEF domain-containing protein [Lachnospiraceae bacterium]
MSDYRKIIAVCGVWLYEEKEYGFIKELNKMCSEKGYVVMAFNFSIDTMTLEDDIIREKKLLELMSYLDCSAVIIMGETIKSERMFDCIKKNIKSMNVPTFTLECPIEGCINISMCFGDGFRNIVNHIIKDHGCRKVNMIAGVKDNSFSEDRIQVYKEVLQENGIPFEEKRLGYGNFWDRPARQVTEQFLEEGDIPEAIICANDVMAVAACKVLDERGIHVPEDIIVTGFDGIESAKINYPSISTVAPDYEEEVNLIFQMLEKIEKCEKVDLDKTYKISFKVLKNQSCGCGKIDEREARDRISTFSVLANDQKWHMMALNKMLLYSSEKDKLSDMTSLLEESIGLWVNNLYFVAVYEQFYNGSDELAIQEKPGYAKEDSCVTLLNEQNYDINRDRTPFKEEILMPDMKEIFRTDNGYDMFMVRLINTKSDLYGYIIEGFRDVDARSMRRCEEFGLFLSTAITAVLKNQKLIQLNEKLRRINKEMEQASIRDYLTELYNRRGFYDELYKIVHSKDNEGKYLTFCSIDMDGLKIINDTYGHDDGDFALKALASAIKHFAIRNGICARYGGDEFVCALLTEVETNFNADIIRARFKSTFDKNKELAEKPYDVCASIGCRCAMITPGLNLDELMRIADEEMYQDKLSRRKSRD